MMGSTQQKSRNIERGPRLSGGGKPRAARAASAEQAALARLREITRLADPLGFLVRVLEARPAVGGREPQIWKVKSASSDEVYAVDIDARACDCRANRYSHRCEHLAIADFAARLRFQLLGPGDRKAKR